MDVRVVTGGAVRTAVGGLLLGCALFAGVLMAAPAHAHDTLVSTDPAADSEIARVPASVRLTFNEAVLGIGTGVVVTGPDGDVQTGKAVVVDDTVTQELLGGSPAGAYTVRWRITSADGHPVSGSFAFTAKAGGRATAPPSTAIPTPTTTAVASNEKKKPGSDTSWTKVLLGAAAGAAIGTAYVLARRRRKNS